MTMVLVYTIPTTSKKLMGMLVELTGLLPVRPGFVGIVVTRERIASRALYSNQMLAESKIVYDCI